MTKRCSLRYFFFGSWGRRVTCVAYEASHVPGGCEAARRALVARRAWAYHSPVIVLRKALSWIGYPGLRV